jgi:hypothetical protein
LLHTNQPKAFPKVLSKHPTHIGLGEKMKTSTPFALAYPPPPPPPPTPAKSRKTLVVALLLVLVLASALALGYIATGGFNLGTGTNTKPSPTASATGFATASPTAHPTASATPNISSTPSHTATPTASATPTVTPQPTSTSGDNNPNYANFREGAWANYTIKTYDEDGTVLTESQLKESVASGTYNSTACWLLTITTDVSYAGYSTTMKQITYLNKNTMQGLHIKMYLNDVLTDEYDLNETTTTELGTTQIDPNAIVTYETITVPAGTFPNCAKTQVTNENGKAYVWGHETVPIFGMVKMELYMGTTRTVSQELIAYGG